MDICDSAYMCIVYIYDYSIAQQTNKKRMNDKDHRSLALQNPQPFLAELLTNLSLITTEKNSFYKNKQK